MAFFVDMLGFVIHSLPAFGKRLYTRLITISRIKASDLRFAAELFGKKSNYFKRLLKPKSGVQARLICKKLLSCLLYEVICLIRSTAKLFLKVPRGDTTEQFC